MYYLLYFILLIISLLPFRVLYFISDVLFVISYYIIGYRKKVVIQNIQLAFPEKTEKERKEIVRAFYRNFTDMLIETIKLLHISDEAFAKRARLDPALMNELTRKGLNVQVHSGHQMNWEYAHLAFARIAKVRWIGVYMRINNKATDRLFLKIRSKYNATMLAAQDFTNKIRNFYTEPYMLALIADQNPGWPANAQWLYFFNKPAPFMASPEKGAVRHGTAVVFVNFVKIKRGYYQFEPVLITENAAHFKNGELTREYRNFLEKGIQQQPANYLWSHKRWKFPYNQSYDKRWIDTLPPPKC